MFNRSRSRNPPTRTKLLPSRGAPNMASFAHQPTSETECAARGLRGKRQAGGRRARSGRLKDGRTHPDSTGCLADRGRVVTRRRREEHARRWSCSGMSDARPTCVEMKPSGGNALSAWSS